MNGIPPKIHRTKRLWLIVAIAIAGLFLTALGCGEYRGGGSSSGESGGRIKLAWDPSSDPNVAGYKVYYGTSPGKYGNGFAVGNVTTYDLTGLIKGQKYYLVITAYNKAGKESKFSTEIIGIAK
jgi:hypothetical protein